MISSCMISRNRRKPYFREAWKHKRVKQNNDDSITIIVMILPYINDNKMTNEKIKQNRYEIKEVIPVDLSSTLNHSGEKK